MKNMILIAVMFFLAGCETELDKHQKAVLSQLYIPESGIIKDIKITGPFEDRACGMVSAMTREGKRTEFVPFLSMHMGDGIYLASINPKPYMLMLCDS